jgi:magnesium transporter
MTTIYYSNARSAGLSEEGKLRNGAWVHVAAPDESEISELSKKYKLDENLLSDAVDLYEAPRVERSDNSVYVYTRYYHADNGVINATEPLLIVYRPTYVLTLTRIKSAVLNPLVNNSQQVITTQKTKLLLQILEAVNTSYGSYLTRATRQILQVRSQLRRTDIDSQVLLNFIEVEDDLNEFISALQPQSAVLRGLLSGRFMPLYEEDKDLVEDLSLGTSELIELVKSRLKTIISIRQAYDAIAANELNKTFRRLTSISIFLMVPTVVSGLYGMNVLLPLQDDSLSFWYILLFITAATTTLIAVFRRKRWL